MDYFPWNCKPVENNINTIVGDDRPCFFKIIFGQTKKELKIPPKFIQHHLNEMGDTDRATLKGPFYDTWTIVVHNKEKGVYLKHGWQDFIRYHSLGNSEFLLFRHEGNFHFSVRIFDPNGLERVSESVTCKHQEAKCRLGRSRIAGIKLSSESCKLAAAFLARIRKQGRPPENNVGAINLHPVNDESEAGKDKFDPINNLHQSECCKHEQKSKPGRPRKNKVIDTPSLDELKSCKHALKAASCGKRKRGSLRKKKDDDLLHQSKSCKYGSDGTGLSFPCRILEKVKESMKIEYTMRKIKEKELEATDAKAGPLLEVKEEEKDNDERKEEKGNIHKEHHLQTMCPPIEEGATALEKADSFISKFPFYRCCLQKYNVQKMFMLVTILPFSLLVVYILIPTLWHLMVRFLVQ